MREHLAGDWINGTADRDIKHVIVPVTERIIAFAI